MTTGSEPTELYTAYDAEIKGYNLSTFKIVQIL